MAYPAEMVPCCCPEAELRELLGEPGRRAATKDRAALQGLDREWLAASPFCVIATAALCPHRSSWIHYPPASARLPPARLTAYAPNDIIRTRSQRYASCSHACYCGNCITVPFVDRARDDPPRQYPLLPHRKQTASDSAPSAKHRPLTSPC